MLRASSGPADILQLHERQHLVVKGGKLLVVRLSVADIPLLKLSGKLLFDHLQARARL